MFWSFFQPLLAQGSISGLCFHVWQHFLLHGVVCNAIWSAFGLVFMFTVPKQALLASETFGDTAYFDLMLRNVCRKTWFKMWVPRGPIAILRSILLQCFAAQSYKIMCSGRKLRRTDAAKGMCFFFPKNNRQCDFFGKR